MNMIWNPITIMRNNGFKEHEPIDMKGGWTFRIFSGNYNKHNIVVAVDKDIDQYGRIHYTYELAIDGQPACCCKESYRCEFTGIRLGFNGHWKTIEEEKVNEYIPLDLFRILKYEAHYGLHWAPEPGALKTNSKKKKKRRHSWSPCRLK